MTTSVSAWPTIVQEWADLHRAEWDTAGRIIGLHDRLAALLTSNLPDAAATVDVLLEALGRCDYDMDRDTWALWWLVSGFEHLGPVIPRA